MSSDKPLVLVVDDNATNIDLLVDILKNDYRVAIAKNGLKALSYLEKHLPDLILLDIMMPEMNGYEVCTRLKDDPRTHGITVIFITAMSETVNKTKGFDVGAVDYITKPFHAAEVKVRVRTHLSLQRMREKLSAQNIELQNNYQALQESMEKLKNTQEQLVQSEKMAALGGLVAGVAHEINTPVGIGVTESSFLQEETRKFSELYSSGKLTRSGFEKYIKNAVGAANSILANLQRAAELITSFKQVAVDQSTEERRNFKVKEYVNEILLSLRSKYKRTKHSITVTGPDNLAANSYPGAFSQIVTNLLMNTLIHGFEGIEEGKIGFEITDEGEQIKFIYKDDGVGMSEETLKKIFDPFYTTKRGFGGTGLGMHIVFNLVTQTLGGNIECESERGKGTTFIITFNK